MGKLNTFEANTLVEVIVALVIGSVLFAVGGLLFNNLWTSGKTALELRAETLVHNTLVNPSEWEMPDAGDELRVYLTSEARAPGVKMLIATALNPAGDTLCMARKIVRDQ